MINRFKMEFDAKGENEKLARVAVAAFVMELNPTLEELADVKTAVSEAVTNSIIHGYEGKNGKVILQGKLENRTLHISIYDKGVGIENVKQAMEPLYTSKPGLERSGMGFSFMEAFMDKVEVKSKAGHGTLVCMKKEFEKSEELDG